MLLGDGDKSVSESKTPQNGRKPITIFEMKGVLELLEADSSYEISKEFEEIRTLSSEWSASCSVAELPENRPKNRYCDILPCKIPLIFTL